MKWKQYVLSCMMGLAITHTAAAATLQATYLFHDTLSAQEISAPALTAVNPLGLNSFETALVYGQNRRVYHWDGNTTPAEQAGLSLDTTGLITANNYSLELVFEFLGGNNAWRRIVDVQNRTSDNGFYVDTSNHLAVYPLSGGSTAWTNNTFHHVVLTNTSGTTARGYLDGGLEFTLATGNMNINNADDLAYFFLDNITGSGAGEFSDGRVALIRVYDGGLTDEEVRQLAQDPFGASAVPEPASVVLLVTGMVGLVAWRRRQGQV